MLLSHVKDSDFHFPNQPKPSCLQQEKPILLGHNYRRKTVIPTAMYPTRRK